MKKKIKIMIILLLKVMIHLVMLLLKNKMRICLLIHIIKNKMMIYLIILLVKKKVYSSKMKIHLIKKMKFLNKQIKNNKIMTN